MINSSAYIRLALHLKNAIQKNRILKTFLDATQYNLVQMYTQEIDFDLGSGFVDGGSGQSDRHVFNTSNRPTPLRATNKCYFGLMKHLTSELLSHQITSLTFRTLIRPVRTYGSQTWL